MSLFFLVALTRSYEIDYQDNINHQENYLQDMRIRNGNSSNIKIDTNTNANGNDRLNNRFRFKSKYKILEENRSRNNDISGNSTHSSSALNSNNTTSNKKYYNNTLAFNIESQIKPNHIIKSVDSIKASTQKIEYYLNDPQLDTILRVFLSKNDQSITRERLNGFMNLFLEHFSKCDVNNDNKLDYQEYVNCMKTDKYLKIVYDHYFFDKLQQFPNNLFSNIKSKEEKSDSNTKSRKQRLSKSSDKSSTTSLVNKSTSKSTSSSLNPKTLIEEAKRKVFLRTLFNNLDYNYNDYLNFYQYMQLRLLVFSWKKCSTIKPHISETEFVCALEVVNSVSKSKMNNLVKRIFNLSLELSNYNHHIIEATHKKYYDKLLFNTVVFSNKHSRNMDFLRFSDIALSSYLYSSVNQKDDGDLSHIEFMNSLQVGKLPIRFNAEIIDMFFKLSSGEDRQYHDIDLFTFIFNDYFLKKFFMKNISIKDLLDGKVLENNNGSMYKNKIKYRINKEDLLTIISQYDFPEIISLQICNLPFNKLKKNDYNKHISIKHHEKYIEDDYLLFTSINEEKKDKDDNKLSSSKGIKGSKSNLKISSVSGNSGSSSSSSSSSKSSSTSSSSSSSSSSSKTTTTVTTKTLVKYLIHNLKNGVDYLYPIMDNDSDELISYYDYMTMIQVFYIFNNFSETKQTKNIQIPELLEYLSNYSNLPLVRKEINTRALHLKEIKNALKSDVFYTYVILRFEDFVIFKQNNSSALVDEVNLRTFLKKIDAEFMPQDEIDAFCMRDKSDKHVLYDWRCAVEKAIDRNLQITDVIRTKKLVDDEKINLKHTGFYSFNDEILK